MKRTIKFGIFGLGRGSTFYKNILMNNGEIVAVCDISEEKLVNAKKELGEELATYTSFDEFINHEGLEAIFQRRANCRSSSKSARQRRLHRLSSQVFRGWDNR